RFPRPPIAAPGRAEPPRAIASVRFQQGHGSESEQRYFAKAPGRADSLWSSPKDRPDRWSPCAWPLRDCAKQKRVAVAGPTELPRPPQPAAGSRGPRGAPAEYRLLPTGLRQTEARRSAIAQS